MKKDKINDVIMQIYRKLYAASTPPADFDLLVEESPLNEHGQKVIPYDQYEIDQKLFDDIIEEILTDTRIPKYMKNRIKTTVLLGCSPKFKRII